MLIAILTLVVLVVKMHLNALYSPDQKKKTILETVKIATEAGYDNPAK